MKSYMIFGRFLQDFVRKNNFTDHSFAASPGRGARFLREDPAFRFGHSLR